MSKFAIFCFIAIPTIFFFFKWAYKYQNPYKLYFVFGKKGSGKSSYLARLALQYSKKGWIVYTNVKDLAISGVRIIDDVSKLGDFVPAENSIMLLDEVSLVWDNRNFKSFKDSTKEFFRLQRHYKCLVFLFSQTFDVDKKIRDLADNMYLVTQFLGRWSLLREIDKNIVLTDASADNESRIAENLSFRSVFHWRFTYLPNWQKYFNSFDLPERPQIDFVEVPKIDLPEKEKPLRALTKRLVPRRLMRAKHVVEAPREDDFSVIEKSVLEAAEREPSYSDIADFWKR